jgi:hypothetical protein
MNIQKALQEARVAALFYVPGYIIMTQLDAKRRDSISKCPCQQEALRLLEAAQFNTMMIASMYI